VLSYCGQAVLDDLPETPGFIERYIPCLFLIISALFHPFLDDRSDEDDESTNNEKSGDKLVSSGRSAGKDDNPTTPKRSAGSK
jgi:hypothetical protein